MKLFCDEIRDAVRQSGMTNYRVAAEMRVATSVVHRFMKGGSISARSLDKLAQVLDLHVRVGSKKGK